MHKQLTLFPPKWAALSSRHVYSLTIIARRGARRRENIKAMPRPLATQLPCLHYAYDYRCSCELRNLLFNFVKIFLPAAFKSVF